MGLAEIGIGVIELEAEDPTGECKRNSRADQPRGIGFSSRSLTA